MDGDYITKTVNNRKVNNMGVVFWDKFTDNTDIKGNYLAQNVGHGGEMSPKGIP